MANHSSAQKALRQTIKKTLINQNRASRIKTFIKKVLKAVELGSKEEAQAALDKMNKEDPHHGDYVIDDNTPKDKHAKIKEALKKGLKELINPKDIQAAKTSGGVINIPDQDTAAIQAAEKARVNYRKYKA